ncbi:2-aminoethylphosphonate--pyruvate transaminase [Brevibacillus sp. HD1.4A]|uniref:2-aminoethylphosphonate--pyruvate transaminase n=1 Tax=Brevibacillus sp. HD1.4A TaxID=2738978 RepID=UPI00156AA32F|nr:2-aminoethylphosphonate--pyruvate transaminase [Brevibacillus sp. HD1.4A]NRQ57108.1 2-aminoethylphosphonate--pyruvate transaminase [Brevibacillus sp. HD1.4A]
MTQTTTTDNPYLLLTPGPLSTSRTVREAMMRDWCTWDRDYNELVQSTRQKLVGLATTQTDDYTSVLMQGSGSFCVEAVISSVIPKAGKLLVLTNGAYGDRIVQMAQVHGIHTTVIDFGELAQVEARAVEQALAADGAITHVAVVHSETTTGMLNPIVEIGAAVKKYGKVYIVDAMSSFGGIPLDVAELSIDFLISSANKCIQGVPGFGFVIAKTSELHKCAGVARTLSLDLYDQWKTMEEQNGKWRYTSPTHVVRAFYQALLELEQEGGVAKRYERYKQNQAILSEGMERLGLRVLLPKESQSPFITSFYYPEVESFSFAELYERLKQAGFVIYPGKISQANTFRIGNIGEVYPADMERLLAAVEANRFWL